MTLASGLFGDAGFWDVAAAVQGDRYLVLYGVVPAWLIIVGVELPRGSIEPWLIREGSRSSRFARWASRFAWRSLVVAFIPAAAGLTVALGRPLGPGWHSEASESSAVFDATGTAPPVMLVLGVVLLSAGLTSMAAVAFLLHERWGGPGASVVILAAIFVITVVSSVRPGQLDVSCGLMVCAAHRSWWAVGATAAGLAAAITALWLIVRLYEGRKDGLPLGACSVVLGSLTLVVVMATHAVPMRGSRFTLADLLRTAFAGGDDDQLYLLGFVTYALVFGGGALLISAQAVQRDRDRLPLLAVRYGRLNRWVIDVAVRIVTWSAGLVAALLVVSTVLTLVFGGRLLSVDLPAVVTVVGLIGAGQTIFLAWVTAVTLAVTPEPRVVAGVFTIEVLLAAPVINRSQLLPLGLNLTGQITSSQTTRNLIYISVTVGTSFAVSIIGARSASVQRRILGRF